MKLKVEAVKSIADGLHTGIIKKLDYREQPYNYVDVILSLDNEELDLKVGFPINLTLQTGLGRLLSRFGCDLVVGDQVELEKWLLGKKCQFMTMNEKTDRGSFARVIPDSLKPLEKV